MPPGPSRRLDAVLAALNGVIGDHLHRRGNGLATETVLLHRGEPLLLEREALARSLPLSSGKVAVWLHGLCVDEGVWSDPSDPDRSFPARLERELGFVPLLLRYNSGRHVSDNGELVAGLLEALAKGTPAVEELLLVGYSMGGLVLRSACHAGARQGHRWLRRVRQAIYLGVPHLGSPYERIGRGVAWTLRAVPNGVTRLLASVGDVRSAGVQDMGRGRILREHWEGADPASPFHEPHEPLPLLPGIRHGLIAGRLGEDERHLVSALLGDGMVPVASAVGAGGAQVRIVAGVGHLGLTRHPEVWAQLRAWCREDAR